VRPAPSAVAAVWFASAILAAAAPVTLQFKLDHFGYRPLDRKVAIATADPGAAVELRNQVDQTVFTIPQYVGKPTGVTEPAYPYFAGEDNLGISDDLGSLLGPAPGLVPGGPNRFYSGSAEPPGAAVFYNRVYRDWCYNGLQAELRPWEITEPSISYQGPHAALAASSMLPEQIVVAGSAAAGGSRIRVTRSD
jgi:hypothetical protein